MRLKVTGGTGVGKSSTINALFGREISRVGIHAEPETMGIKSYELNGKKTRIIAALNKCDAVMPRHWDYTNTRPDDVLTRELDDRAEILRNRIKRTTGVDVETMFHATKRHVAAMTASGITGST